MFTRNPPVRQVEGGLGEGVEALLQPLQPHHLLPQLCEELHPVQHPPRLLLGHRLHRAGHELCNTEGRVGQQAGVWSVGRLGGDLSVGIVCLITSGAQC